MAEFIEVAPIEYGKEQPRMLINTEKIDYVREDSNGLTLFCRALTLLIQWLKEVIKNEQK